MIRAILRPVILCCCLITTVAVANTYYVSPSGSDTNNGVTTGMAWRTLAKVSGSVFSPGDSILFERGGEWREILDASSSGTPTNPITYADYGIGDKPTFWGSEVLDNSAFELDSGTTYRITITSEVTSVLIDHDFMFGDATDISVNSVGDVSALSNSWYWSSDVLYVNTGSFDPRVDGRTYTAVVREDLLTITGVSNLVFRNLVVKESARDNFGYGVLLGSSKNILMEDCEAYHCGKHHFSVINTTGFIGRRLYGAYAMPGQGASGASTFVAFSDPGQAQNTTSEWLDCLAEHMDDTYTSSRTYPAFVMHGGGIGSVLISNMTSYGSSISIAGTNATVIGGTISDADLSVYSDYGYVHGLRISGPDGGMNISGDRNVIENCLIEGADPRDGTLSAVVLGGCSNTLRFSSIILSDSAPSTSTCLAIEDSSNSQDTHAIWYGNIMMAQERVFKKWYHDLAPGHIDFADYNFYNTGAEFKDDNTVYSFAQWQAEGYDSQTLTGDPVFMDSGSGNYRLTESSLCIDAVVSNASALMDFDGIGRPLDGDTNGLAIADKGAFEFAHPEADTDGDSLSDAAEVIADTNPTDSSSLLTFTDIQPLGGAVSVGWIGGRDALQTIECSTNVTSPGAWATIYTNHPPTAVTNSLSLVPSAPSCVYRLRASKGE